MERVCEPDEISYGMLDLEYTAELVETGYRAACEHMAAWLTLTRKH